MSAISANTYNKLTKITMKKEIKCPNCKYEGKSKTAIKGNFLIEIVLWLFFIIPGVIYSLWRSTSRHPICPSCGYKYVIIK